MKTHFQITFPQHPGQAFPIAASNGQTLPVRARSDTRPKKGYPVRILTRAEWDDQNKPAGPYMAAYQPKRPVPDVDFEAEDGTLWPTAEACLEHELEVRFGVKTLAAVSADFEAAAALANKKPSNDALYDANGNPPFSGVPQTIAACGPVPPSHKCKPRPASGADGNSPTPAEAARLLGSALARRGLKVAEAAKATGLTPAQVRSTAKSLPGQFASKGGRVFLVS